MKHETQEAMMTIHNVEENINKASIFAKIGVQKDDTAASSSPLTKENSESLLPTSRFASASNQNKSEISPIREEDDFTSSPIKPTSPLPSTDQASLQAEEANVQKMMATWQYTGALNGGVAIDFSALANEALFGSDEDAAFEAIFDALGRVEEEDRVEDEKREAEFLSLAAEETALEEEGEEGGEEEGGHDIMSSLLPISSNFASPTEPGPENAFAVGKGQPLENVMEEEEEGEGEGEAGGGERESGVAETTAPPEKGVSSPVDPSPDPPSHRGSKPPLGPSAPPTSSLHQSLRTSTMSKKSPSFGRAGDASSKIRADLSRSIVRRQTALDLQNGKPTGSLNATGPRSKKGDPDTSVNPRTRLSLDADAKTFRGPSSEDKRESAPIADAGSKADPGASPFQRNSGGALKRNKTIKVSSIEGKIKPLNIVIIIVGTRGDVQPFIGIGLKLKEYGHRVRIASHKVYRDFVTPFGLEFYPIGGDPKVLSEFVVKHRGIMPGLNISDALQQREQVKEILYSSWGACVLPDPETPDNPFVADAIVANPPAYGHTHCAEKLNVPLHIVFTMPWTPTKLFPNPFARIKTVIGGESSKTRQVMNWLSYFAVEDLAWLGMSGMVKDFRKRVLKLTDWSKNNGSHAIYNSKVPMTYIWSPSLVDRPSDWPSYCEVVGFVNLDLQKLTMYSPPKELADFMDAGPPPVYIGFGSLVVDNPEKLTQQFLQAIKATGLRAIIQKGWGGLGAGVTGSPENVLFIGPAPHDWLFHRCCAVIHHGGAGTTACGLYCGKPTFIVPFFGDQPFWGAACHNVGAGPPPVDIDSLTTEKIVDALKTLILPSCQTAAKMIQEKMLREDGIQATVDHLHRTFYGAILAGNTFTWMKRGAERALDSVIEEVERDAAKSQMPKRPSEANMGSVSTSSTVTEGAPSVGGLRGFLAIPSSMGQRLFGSKKKPPSVASRLNEVGLASGASEGALVEEGGGVGSGSAPPPGEDPQGPVDANGRALRPVEVAEEDMRRVSSKKSSGGLFSFLGC